MAEAISSTLDWAWLPGDILDLILEKLISTSDFIRLGAVCKHWQSGFGSEAAAPQIIMSQTASYGDFY
ncbi:unnamed protein product [Prunus armeniaca]